MPIHFYPLLQTTCVASHTIATCFQESGPIFSISCRQLVKPSLFLRLCKPSSCSLLISWGPALDLQIVWLYQHLSEKLKTGHNLQDAVSQMLSEGEQPLLHEEVNEI